MGWAKYSEDNIEIMLERQVIMQNEMQERARKNSFKQSNSPILEMTFQEERHIVTPKQKYKDRYIVCRDCGRKFLFSAHCQKLYESKGWSTPKRCKNCRDFRTISYLMSSSF